jgi:hypothetical protein
MKEEIEKIINANCYGPHTQELFGTEDAAKEIYRLILEDRKKTVSDILNNQEGYSIYFCAVREIESINKELNNLK